MSNESKPARRFYPLTPSDFFNAMLGGWKMADDRWEDFWEKGFMPETFRMKADIQETDAAFILEADLPGFKKENISVEYREGRLYVNAKKEEETKVEKKNYLRQERYYGEVSRRFRVEGIKEQEISAEYKDGVLKVTMPKAEPKPESKQAISIK